MNTLDSRCLRLGDCYAQKFARQGEFRYTVSAGAYQTACSATDSGETYSITVQDGHESREPKQHIVTVSRGKGGLTVDTPSLTVGEGDTVLWYTTDGTLGFSVSGSGPELQFGNGALKAEAIYTHAFGVDGDVQWADPAHGDIGGSVHVGSAVCKSDAERDQWLERLAQPAAFEIRDGRVLTESADIVVGQTVFWKVWDGDGMAVVDKRLIA